MDKDSKLICINNTIEELTERRAEKCRLREYLSKELADLDWRIKTLDEMRTEIETPVPA